MMKPTLACSSSDAGESESFCMISLTCLFEGYIFAKWLRFLQVLQIWLYVGQLPRKCEYERNLHSVIFPLLDRREFCSL